MRCSRWPCGLTINEQRHGTALYRWSSRKRVEYLAPHFASTYFLATPLGTQSSPAMKGASTTNGSDFSADNIITPKVEELTDADRQELEAQKLKLERLFLTRFKKTRQGTIIKEDNAPPISITTDVPEVSVPKVQTSSASVTPEDLSGMFLQFSKSMNDAMEQSIANALKFNHASPSYTPPSVASIPPNSSATPVT